MATAFFEIILFVYQHQSLYKLLLRYFWFVLILCTHVRKRTSVEVGSAVLNGDCNSKSKSSRSMSRDCGDHKQADVREKDSSLYETEAPAPSSRNPSPSDLSTHTVHTFFLSDWSTKTCTRFVICLPLTSQHLVGKS